jgi:NHL repeat-containing protein
MMKARGMVVFGVLAGATAVAGPAAVRAESGLEVVVSGVPRPLQLAVDGRTLLVLSPGERGDAAGELHRVDLAGPRPVHLAAQPRVRIPFADARTATLGSLARDPASGALYFGEENGARIWRLGAEDRLTLFATGLRRLAGGSTLIFDGQARLVAVDWVDPVLTPDEERTAPGFEQFREEDYRGPLVFRLATDLSLPLPRQLQRLAPFFPRAWGGRAGGARFPLLVAAAPLGADELAVLTSGGDLYRLGVEGRLVPLASLPRGQYLRVNMVTGSDGSLWISGGFWMARLFRVWPDGAVSTVASGLADPQGLALDGAGHLYLAESGKHRIVRLKIQ